jgi:hypothetical protein
MAPAKLTSHRPKPRERGWRRFRWFASCRDLGERESAGSKGHAYAAAKALHYLMSAHTAQSPQKRTTANGLRRPSSLPTRRMPELWQRSRQCRVRQRLRA